ncbi:MAG TPA: DUF2294 domain-containing protein [Solirubrobacteraceae bacterium]|nr:DUF2294 domain-containing protein [Solirubrobacteraceae bacterium]
MTSTHTEHSPTGSKAAAISNHVVRTISEYTGRGPTKARTYINEDVVICVLQDTLTKGERSLVSDDLDDLVLTMRKAFQSTMREDLVGGIEQILGRKVIAFMSDNHIDPDAAVEVFLLEPLPHTSRNDRGRHDGARSDGANHDGARRDGANHDGALRRD